MRFFARGREQYWGVIGAGAHPRHSDGSSAPTHGLKRAVPVLLGNLLLIHSLGTTVFLQSPLVESNPTLFPSMFIPGGPCPGARTEATLIGEPGSQQPRRQVNKYSQTCASRPPSTHSCRNSPPELRPTGRFLALARSRWCNSRNCRGQITGLAGVKTLHDLLGQDPALHALSGGCPVPSPRHCPMKPRDRQPACAGDGAHLGGDPYGAETSLPRSRQTQPVTVFHCWRPPSSF